MASILVMDLQSRSTESTVLKKERIAYNSFSEACKTRNENYLDIFFSLSFESRKTSVTRSFGTALRAWYGVVNLPYRIRELGGYSVVV
jgi:hypothetical protein